jgi:hypothetical protein
MGLRQCTLLLTTALSNSSEHANFQRFFEHFKLGFPWRT